MRLLVCCASCNRRFDASACAPGSRFHCYCGEVISVAQPRGHNASVVRCAACGGALQHDGKQCSYCDSTLSLHERDLHTVCPGCFARVSDRASFCHHCGERLDAEQLVETISQHACPVCDEATRLRHRTLNDEGISALECGRCAGLWLEKSTFEGLLQQARSTALPHSAGLGGPPARPAGTLQQEGRMYRPCVVCEKIMARHNFARASGVVIDVCHEHGIWFDAHELDAILRWVRGGGLERAEKRQLEDRQLEMRRLASGQTSSPHSGPTMLASPIDGQRPSASSLLEFAVDALLSVFGRL